MECRVCMVFQEVPMRKIKKSIYRVPAKRFIPYIPYMVSLGVPW